MALARALPLLRGEAGESGNGGGVMTAQEIFEKVVRGLAAQGWEQSVDDDLACAYRGEGGLRCAAGHLMTDEHYCPDFEGDRVSDLRVIEALEKSGVTENLLGLVDVLQTAHDEHSAPEDMALAFAIVAHDHGLTWPADVARPEVPR